MKKLFYFINTALFIYVCSFAMAQSISPISIVRDTGNCKMIDDYLVNLEKEKSFSGGLLIIKNGETIFKKGYGLADKENNIPFTNTTLASIGSITKSFTAVAILKLAEQKKLNLQDNLQKYFTTVPKDKATITIHQLLTHSGGFHEFMKDDKGDYEKLNTEEFLHRAFSEPLSFTPGTKAIYTNVGMSILAIIIEKISGLDYESFLQKELFHSVGIKHIGYQFPTESKQQIAIGYQHGSPWGTHQSHFEKADGGPYWNLKGNGGLEASLDEMELWINAISKNKILNEKSTEKMFMAHVDEEGYNGESSFGYGCNISESKRKTKMITNGGSNGVYYARIIRFPEEGIIFFMITNESSINTSMVIPNITQLYYIGKIEHDATLVNQKFENELSKKVYDILNNNLESALETELAKEKINIDDDMILLEVGQHLIQENKFEKALALYTFYTNSFPNIVVAWNDLGDVYLKLNNKEAAIKSFKKALKIRPENMRAKESLQKLGQ